MTTEPCNCEQALALKDELAELKRRVENLEMDVANLRTTSDAARDRAIEARKERDALALRYETLAGLHDRQRTEKNNLETMALRLRKELVQEYGISSWDRGPSEEVGATLEAAEALLGPEVET